jgi:hypothetical protein
MMQPTSRHQFLRDVLELSKQRMLSKVVSPSSNKSIALYMSSTSLSSLEKINENLGEIILGIGYIIVIIPFLIKILLRIIRNFEYYDTSPYYNRFGFIANENSSDFDSDENSHVESLSSPISLRPTLSLRGKHFHLQTPVQTMNAVTPKTPAPLRRSLRLKIKSELNLCAMQNNSVTMITRSKTKQNQAMTISSDPCPCPYNRGSMTTPSPHPEHDEERAYYIRYCNEKKMTKKRAEFNSPLFVRRLVL